MKTNTLRYAGLIALALALAGCASSPGGGSIYVPAGGSSSRDEAPQPPQTSSRDEEPRVVRKSEQPEEPVSRQEYSAPSYQDEGDALSPAARSLIKRADSLMASGETQAAVAQLERAQRIAPRSAEVYFKLSEAYVAMEQLGSAEQFTLKGLSLAGSDASLQRSGWMLLADIRRARGNVAGADQAEARAGAL
ncbi:tetratricopeptide repeat protein [Marinobacter orientalis]|uniref:Tetratricopeptide repeat protein n=1 Tax=Marinobacter orientalis TaxID=1928859 RepID=A0A7Y0RBS3_9GAMM|nr:tetratricopeptide repeat protein [Marinobacter orientalis]NMT63332.1 tetratricopeptide repeat protein [Marinobacter orientalis]TGX51977.1 tetratricopeptide repeat protein [Marinobacter orientalis]